jgi:hypothetical protein
MSRKIAIDNFSRQCIADPNLGDSSPGETILVAVRCLDE